MQKLDPEFQGYVLYDSKDIHVFIDDRLPTYAAIECLIHEWSHVKSRRIGHGLVFIEWNHKIEKKFWKWRSTS